MELVQVNSDPINIQRLTDWLSLSIDDGAVVTFIGKVRSINGKSIELFLEHYPGMTEKSLANIITTARKKWQCNRVAVYHRVGLMHTNENIVFVGISSAHRADALKAVEFIMDMLKNEVPLWKKERLKSDGDWLWVDKKKSDIETLKKWY